jgi:hypothetical protein
MMSGNSAMKPKMIKIIGFPFLGRRHGLLGGWPVERERTEASPVGRSDANLTDQP